MSVTVIDKRLRFEEMNKGLKSLFDSLYEIKAAKGKRAVTDAVMTAMQPLSPDEPVEARISRATQAAAQVRGTGQPSGPFGFKPIDRVLGAFNPNVPIFGENTRVEDLLSGEAVANAFYRPTAASQASIRSRNMSAYKIAIDTRTTLRDAQSGYTQGDPQWEQIQNDIRDVDGIISNIKQEMGVAAPGPAPFTPILATKVAHDATSGKLPPAEVVPTEPVGSQAPAAAAPPARPPSTQSVPLGTVPPGSVQNVPQQPAPVRNETEEKVDRYLGQMEGAIPTVREEYKKDPNGFMEVLFELDKGSITLAGAIEQIQKRIAQSTKGDFADEPQHIDAQKIMDALAAAHPEWTDDQIRQAARVAFRAEQKEQ